MSKDVAKICCIGQVKDLAKMDIFKTLLYEYLGHLLTDFGTEYHF